MSRHRIRTTMLGLLATTALTTTALVAPAGATAWAGGDRDRRLDAGVTELHRLGVTGVQGAARAGGRTTFARAGTADLATGAPVPRDGSFRMGSNTKTFTAVVVLQLVGEGRLGLDDPVERWLPGLVAGNGNDGRRITVRQLLQHTSGLFNYTEDMPVFASQEAFEAGRFGHYDPADLVAIALRHEPLFAPGTHWSYSNTNYVLAGMIVERVTGEPLARQVHRRISGPLGLRHTYAPGDDPDLPRRHAKGYHQFTAGGPLIDATRFNTTGAYGAGDLVTTPSDLMRFWQALQSGRLLAPAQLAQMRTTVLAETFQEFLPGVRYGLGVMWVPSSCGGYWGHGGDVPGMSTGNGVTDRGDRVVVLSLSTQFADERSETVSTRAEDLVEDVLCAR